MKTSRPALLFAALVLTLAPSVQAQSRGSLIEALRRTVVRAPLNTNTTVTRSTPQGDVTITTQNTFNGSSGTFATSVSLPNSNTASLAGSINVTPGSGASVTGSLTGPGGQSTLFTNTITASAGSLTVTSAVTPPSGNTLTRTNTFTPPANTDDEDNSLAAFLRRLIASFTPRR